MEHQGPLFDLLGEAGLELMMEIIDKAPALGRIDPRDLVAIADAHGGGGMEGGVPGGGASGGLGGMAGFEGAGEEASGR